MRRERATALVRSGTGGARGLTRRRWRRGRSWRRRRCTPPQRRGGGRRRRPRGRWRGTPAGRTWGRAGTRCSPSRAPAGGDARPGGAEQPKYCTKVAKRRVPGPACSCGGRRRPVGTPIFGAYLSRFDGVHCGGHDRLQALVRTADAQVDAHRAVLGVSVVRGDHGAVRLLGWSDGDVSERSDSGDDSEKYTL